MTRLDEGMRNQMENCSTGNTMKILDRDYMTAPSLAEQIPVKYKSEIIDKRYTTKVIYESYRPENIKQMQDYFHFILNFRKVLPNTDYFADAKKSKEDRRALMKYIYISIYIYIYILRKVGMSDVDEILKNSEVSQDIKDYYNTDMTNTLPPTMNGNIYIYIYNKF